MLYQVIMTGGKRSLRSKTTNIRVSALTNSCVKASHPAVLNEPDRVVHCGNERSETSPRCSSREGTFRINPGIGPEQGQQVRLQIEGTSDIQAVVVNPFCWVPQGRPKLHSGQSFQSQPL